jgi:phosphate transport system substrate-binding protein
VATTTTLGDAVIKNKLGVLAGCALLALGITACGSSSSSSSNSTSSSAATTAPAASSSSKTATTPPSGNGTISGAGSTFAAPVYEQWASSQSGLTVNYQAVGSGAGITALSGKVVDFGASDPPLKEEEEKEIEKNGSPPVQIPMFLGAITVSYNLSGVKSGLKLDGQTLGDIFIGKIKTWNDAEIKALNPGVTLPSTPITVVHRSDSSGTTSGFTGFLSAVDPEFKSKVGEGKEVPWPTGTGAKGNAGVAGAVKQTEGAVGYVEQAYALQNGFTYAAVKNKAGTYVSPTLASTSAAGEGVKIPANLGIKVINSPAPTAYPITSQTFIVVNKDLCKANTPGGEEAAKGVVKFIEYGLGAGQSILKEADYAKLPAPILSKSEAAVKTLECNGSPIGG